MTPLEAFCLARKVRCEVRAGKAPLPEGWPKGTQPHLVTLRYKRRQLTVPFYTGPAWTREPSAADVLSCLLSDASCADQPFETWCGDFGYDPDSRKALATYEACVATKTKLERFLGSELKLFASQEH